MTRFICWRCDVEWRSDDNRCENCGRHTPKATPGQALFSLTNAPSYHDPLYVTGGIM